jgi:diadenosine tetraphosphate (Ap4A) HIT family hydrolase
MLIYDEGGLVVFHDIDKSSAVEHILVCPRDHIPDITALSLKDISLIQKMHFVGEKLLDKIRPNFSKR